MGGTHGLELVLGLASAILLLVLVLFILFYRKRWTAKNDREDMENIGQKRADEASMEDLMTFQGGEDLTICDILDAPGEVTGKSDYGTLYKALMPRSGKLRILRFLRPVCSARAKEFGEAIRLLGSIRHPNLVPLVGFYAGPRGEKLIVHPFYRRGNLAEFIRDGHGESHKWANVYSIAVGVAKGLEHLHAGMYRPVIHGNLKSKNILLDRNYEACVSDFGLHLLLNANAGQEMLEASAAEGYRAPELIKMRDASEETDIYSFGVILLELLSGKEPINQNPTPDEDFYLPDFMRNAVLGHRIGDIFHPDLLLSNRNDDRFQVTEECILKFFQLAMSCCSPSPSLRPNIKQVLWKLEDIGK